MTASNYQEFWRCGSCRRVYWEGKSFQMAVEHYRQFARAAPEAPSERAAGHAAGSYLRYGHAGPRAALE